MYTSFCLPYLAPPNISSSMQSWMREPDCITSFGEWHESHLDLPPWTHTDWLVNANSEAVSSIEWESLTTPGNSVGCCDFCEIMGGNVDVYYWPVPGAKTDCLSTIGTSLGDPDHGVFTTDSRGHSYFESKPNPWTTSNPPTLVLPRSVLKRIESNSSSPYIISSMGSNKSLPANQTVLGSIDIISDHTL